MPDVHPTRLARFHLLAVLLGVALTFAVDRLIHDPFSPLLIATAGYLLNSINFYHGKVVTLEDEKYNLWLLNRPGSALTDNVLNILIALCFVFEAFLLDKPSPLLIVNLLLRAADLMLVVIVWQISSEGRLQTAQRVWFIIDVTALVYFGGLLFLSKPLSNQLAPWLAHVSGGHAADPQQTLVSAAYLAFIVGDILFDYFSNREFYFAVADNWNDLAPLWDRLQGADGDSYRRYIILPAVLTLIRDPAKTRVLDLGCGNGCLARAFAKRGATVVAVDRSQALLAAADKYEHPGVLYSRIDLDRRARLLKRGDFGLIVACFTMQDCKRLSRPMTWIRRNLADCGLAAIILENDESFERSDKHFMTRREWLDPPKLKGRGRRQLIFWKSGPGDGVANAGPNAPDDYESVRTFKTVTRHWSEPEYLLSAYNAGLQFVSARDLQPDLNDPDDDEIRSYRPHPRFRMLLLTKRRC